MKKRVIFSFICVIISSTHANNTQNKVMIGKNIIVNRSPVENSNKYNQCNQIKNGLIGKNENPKYLYQYSSFISDTNASNSQCLTMRKVINLKGNFTQTQTYKCFNIGPSHQASPFKAYIKFSNQGFKYIEPERNVNVMFQISSGKNLSHRQTIVKTQDYFEGTGIKTKYTLYKNASINNFKLTANKRSIRCDINPAL